jgi:hypothetical protein
MAKSVQERPAKAAQKRLAVAEKELRHKGRPGIEQAMGAYPVSRLGADHQ